MLAYFGSPSAAEEAATSAILRVPGPRGSANDPDGSRYATLLPQVAAALRREAAARDRAGTSVALVLEARGTTRLQELQDYTLSAPGDAA